MARFHDRGGYAVGNVAIILATQNNSEGHKGKGTPHTEITRMLLSMNSSFMWQARRDAARLEARP